MNLYCAAKGYPYVSYRWTRSNKKKVLAVGQRLVFPVKPEDDGVYVCTAFNTVGTTQLRIRLHVSSKFKLKQIRSLLLNYASSLNTKATKSLLISHCDELK